MKITKQYSIEVADGCTIQDVVDAHSASGAPADAKVEVGGGLYGQEARFEWEEEV